VKGRERERASLLLIHKIVIVMDEKKTMKLRLLHEFMAEGNSSMF
jgi:hypothetical protein